MPRQQENMYNRFNDLDAMWEEEDERKEEKKKKDDKKQKWVSQRECDV